MPSVIPYGKGWRCFAVYKLQRKSKTFKSKKEANAWGVKTEADMAAQGTGRGLTFGQACSNYLETVSTRKYASTALFEKRRLAAATVFFGADVPLVSITSERAGQWRDERLKTVSSSTVIREAALLGNLFAVARDEWRVIDRSPFSKLRMPEHLPPRDVVWTWQLIKRVLRAERTGKTAEVIRAFHISLHTTRRLSEVVTGVYYPARGVFELATSKTSRRREFFPVPRRGRKLLPYAFTVGPNEASTLFSRLRQELGIEGLTFHDARASATTWLARRTDVMTLARITGHRNLKTLMDSYYRESADQISARV